MSGPPRGLWPPYLPWNVTKSLADTPMFTRKRPGRTPSTKPLTMIELSLVDDYLAGWKPLALAVKYNLSESKVISLLNRVRARRKHPTIASKAKG